MRNMWPEKHVKVEDPQAGVCGSHPSVSADQQPVLTVPHRARGCHHGHPGACRPALAG